MILLMMLTSFISFIGIEHVLERLIPSMIIKHGGLIAGIEEKEEEDEVDYIYHHLFSY